MPAERGKPDSRGLNFFDITDFSPGIYDNSQIAFGTAPNTAPGIFPAPPGAADASNTFGCMSLQNGGLGPGPANNFPGGVSLGGIGITISTTADITALANSFQVSFDELILGITPAPVGGTQTTTFWSYTIGAPALNQIQTQSYSYTANNKNYCTYPAHTFITSPDVNPVVVLPLAAPAGPNSNLMVYPAVAAPTAFGVDTIEQNNTADGICFVHQGRIGIISFVDYGWPTGVTLRSNEAFNYTDPPQSETWPTQQEYFGPETPFGYGALNSVSAGELFCIKCRGGAIIIQGDLNNPTVTSLPGVQSTGVLFGRTDTDQNGMYYCSQEQGAWVWNGGNTSQKISTQLDDNFFNCGTPITNSTYYGYYCQRWGDWMMFSNNWIFNSTTGAWWRLADPTAHSYFWYVPGYDQRWMYCAQQTATSQTSSFMTRYDRGTPGSAYNWQSLPIKLPSQDRTTSIRELVIRASNPYADAAPQIIATLIDDKGNTSVLDTWTMTTSTNTVQETRLNTGTRQTTTIAVSLACSGSTYAPVVHGLSLGYRPREHAAIT